MDSRQYLKLIRDTFDETLDEFDTSYEKREFDDVFTDLIHSLLETKDDDYDSIFNYLVKNYLKSVEAISKLSPGLSTGLYDEKGNIKINTYNGKMSDIPNDDEIAEDTVFDASSMTKMFTSVLLLKESERGNIDLNKKFSDYNPLLSKVDVKIIDALRFGVNLRTDGRLDEPNISKKIRVERLKSTYVFERDTFIYSDIPYMLVPLLFGKTLEEATENYLNKFYELYKDELGLSKTGYSLINMTGGTVNLDLINDIYSKDGLFDPKANMFEKQVGYISGHAGVTTTVKDLEKLFKSLSHGLLSVSSLKELITAAHDTDILLDKNGNEVIRNGKKVYINRGMGVYLNKGNIRISDMPSRFSPSSFASAGSTGTYCIYDISNGLNMIYLSNARSGLYSKWINTGDYTYGDNNDQIQKNYGTTLISGTGSMKDGSIIRENGTAMTYTRATNNFKEEGLRTLLKLRIAKKVLVKKAKIELSDILLDEELSKIEEVFSGNNSKKIKLKRA